MKRAELEYGRLGKRLMAYLIDTVPLVVVLFLLAYFFFGFDEVLKARFGKGAGTEARVQFLQYRNYIRDGTFFLWVIYCVFMEASRLQGTLGKYAMGLKVVDEDGNALTVKKSIVRNASKLLSYLPVALGFIWAAFNKRRKCWHDFIAKTLVVERSGKTAEG